uniref:Uncharacterized protein n=1 Tax=Arundo donax TaxID=35708 RepID=A0A0A9EUN7_ARUDO
MFFCWPFLLSAKQATRIYQKRQ